MRRFILLLIVLIAAVWGGARIAQDPGYALFAYKTWTVEMPLWLMLVVGLFAFIVFYYLIRLLTSLGNYNQRFSYWLASKKKHRAHKAMCSGLIDLIEGRWKSAENLLVQQVAHSEAPLINYLMAAKAAHAQGAFDRRDKYFRLAHEGNPNANIAIGLTQAKLQLDQKQLEQALATLNHLRSISSYHSYVLRALFEIYWELSDWRNLLELLPTLKKKKTLLKSQYQQAEQEAYVGFLKMQTSNDALEKVWASVPRALRRNHAILACYCEKLIENKQSKLAESLLRESLDKEWSDQLGECYAKIDDQSELQFKHATQWHKSNEGNACLLTLLARLAQRLQLWGQAREFFDRSLQLSQSQQVCKEYGLFLEEQGEFDRAREVYKRGL